METRPPVNISIGEVVNLSFKETGRMLFRTFDLKKWLKLAFVCLLAGAGGGGFSFNFNFPFPGSSSGGAGTPQVPPIIGRIGEFILAHLVAVIVGGLFFMALLIAFLLLLSWLYAVFSFIFIDSVAKNDVRIRGAFSENKTRGTSYFLWNLVVGMIASTAILLMIAIAVVAGLALYFGARDSGAALIAGIVVLVLAGGAVLITFCVALAVLGCFTKDFALPVMYVRGTGIINAWRMLLPLMKAQKSDFLIYLVLKIAFGIGAMMIEVIVVIILALGLLAAGGLGALVLYGLSQAAGMDFKVVGIVALCVLIIPVSLAFVYVRSCVFLPISVFFRTYSLVFLGRVENSLRVSP